VQYKNLDRFFYRFVTIHACDRQTDRRTDRILIAIPRLHYMQHGKNRLASRAEPWTTPGPSAEVTAIPHSSWWGGASCPFENLTTAFDPSGLAYRVKLA